MQTGEVAGLIVVLAALIWFSGEIYDFIQVKRGVFPKKSDTTIDDIKRMRDQGHTTFAVRRFRQLPQNKGHFTLVGAQKEVDSL